LQELKKHAVLLFIVALLLLFKVLIIPVFEWQNTELAEIKLLDKRKDKISNVLAEYDDNISKSDALVTELDKIEPILFTFQPESEFKLTQQKMLEVLIKKHRLNTQNMGWLTSSLLPNLLITRYPIKMNMTGQHSDLINFIAALEVNKKLIEIADFNMSLKGQRGESLGQITSSVTLNFFAQNIIKNSEKVIN